MFDFCSASVDEISERENSAAFKVRDAALMRAYDTAVLPSGRRMRLCYCTTKINREMTENVGKKSCRTNLGKPPSLLTL